jgi:hypothetical protein
VVWRINRILNAVALLAALVLLVALVAVFVASLDTDGDPHGYGRIFSVVLGMVLLVPVILLTQGAVLLHRRRRAGLAYQLAAGVVIGLYALAVPVGEQRWLGIGLATILAVPALIGLVWPGTLRPQSASDEL